MQALFVPDDGEPWQGELRQRLDTEMSNTDTLDGSQGEIEGMKEISWTTDDQALMSVVAVNGTLTADGATHQVWLMGDKFTRSG